tara:strand:+ start:15976 stop:19143 length:3168 start_codon:yes stop_codon:yes gene_type:complete
LKKLLFILLLCNWHSIFCQYYTGSNIPFGQNRVQYNSFFWQSYDFQRFKIYFTKGGHKHAEYTAKTAHLYLQKLEKFLDYKIEDKIHFIIYNSLGKFRQSNIGLTNDISSNIGGTARISGEKVFLYFNGNHNDFNKQISAGIAEIIVQNILFGSDLKQSVKSSSFTNMPVWFKNGLIDYLSTEWNTSYDGKLKNLILSGKAEKFHSLTNKESQLFSFGMWRFIDEVFGRNMIPNLIYMMKVSKSIESGFIYVLGVTAEMLQEDFINHYKNLYNDDISNSVKPNEKNLNIKSKKERVYRQFKINKKGDKIAFVEHYIGQYKVKIYDLKKNKLRTVIKGDHKLNRIPDFSHPVIAWHPLGKVLSIFEEKKGEILLNLYDTDENKKNIKPLLNLEKILSCSYNVKGDKIIISAVSNSQTDIYQYSVLGNSQIQITNDLFDNHNPKYIPNSNEVIFSSNRMDLKKSNPKIPNTNKFDLFQINTKTRKLKQLTNTPNFNEKHPQPVNKFNYHYLCDKNGIYNHFKKTTDSTISQIDTAIHYRYFSVIQKLSNLNRNALEICFTPFSKHYSLLLKNNSEYQFYIGKVDEVVFLEDVLKNTHFIKSTDYKSSEGDKKLVQSSDEINIYNYQFEKEKEIIKNNNQKKYSSSTTKEKGNFILPLKKIYNVNFTIGDFVMQLNPTFNNLAYQRYSSSGFKNAGFDGFTLIQAKDVFEDYKITGGFKGPVQINNTGFIAIYENLKNRLDEKTQLSRQSFENFVNNVSMDAPTIEKTITNDIKHQYSYPFSEVSSLRFTLNLRHDKIVTLSNSPSHLPVPNRTHLLGGGLLEYIFDATRPIAININNGFKFKTWFEGYKEINNPNTDFFVFGMDLRNYQKIHRNIVFASRLAASTSFGFQKLIYYMGGVDGYLWAKFDPSIIPDPEQNFQFQTIATPLRGFYQNARNGNSFVGISNELRIPIFSYFSKKPLKSDFLENFMIIGFNDIGAAWTGKNPYSSDNSFNNTSYNGHNYSINIENQKEPIVYSYGFGIRSKLFGYYIRLDWGYGIDDHIAMPSIKQLSLSLDF